MEEFNNSQLKIKFRFSKILTQDILNLIRHQLKAVNGINYAVASLNQ